MSKKKHEHLTFGSVDDVIAEGTPDDHPSDDLDYLAAVSSDSDIIHVQANRNFDQATRGEIYIVDRNDQYWAEHLASGNVVEVVE